MRDAVRAVQDVVDVPVSIDSYTIDVLLAGLEVAQGRPLVNSIPFETDYMSELLPAIAEHDACLIGMCTKGGAAMPETAEGARGQCPRAGGQRRGVRHCRRPDRH